MPLNTGNLNPEVTSHFGQDHKIYLANCFSAMKSHNADRCNLATIVEKAVYDLILIFHVSYGNETASTWLIPAIRAHKMRA